MTYYTALIISSIVIIHLVFITASLHDPKLEAEGLLSLQVSGNKHPAKAQAAPAHLPKSTRIVESPAHLPKSTRVVESPVHPADNVERVKSQQQLDMEALLQSEALLPFDQPLERYRRADDNIDGSGGGIPTVLCHLVSCTGEACVTAFNKTDSLSQCSSTGSCYLRARDSGTVRSVESRCDTRLECEWQTITLQDFTEVSSCCNTNLCNDLNLLLSHGTNIHKTTQYYLISLLATLVIVYTRYQDNSL